MFSISCLLTLCKAAYADGEPLLGSQYKLIKPLYVMVVYDDPRNKKVSKETAHAYVHSAQYVQKSYVAFQCEVPTGTIMRIAEPVHRVWHLPFFPRRYRVEFLPAIMSIELEFILELNREIEGDLDGLNRQLFSRADATIGNPEPLEHSLTHICPLMSNGMPWIEEVSSR